MVVEVTNMCVYGLRTMDGQRSVQERKQKKLLFTELRELTRGDEIQLLYLTPQVSCDSEKTAPETTRNRWEWV